MTPEVLRDLRHKAATFYYKALSGSLLDWVEGQEANIEDIDDDIVSLFKLLQEVHFQGQLSVTPDCEGKMALPELIPEP